MSKHLPATLSVHELRDGWGRLVWEWVGAFGVATQANLPDRNLTLEYFRTHGVNAVIEVVSDAAQLARTDENWRPGAAFVYLMERGAADAYREDELDE